MVANGDDKPMMFTEFGWSTTTQTCGVTEQQQADYLTKSFQLMAQDPYVMAAIWYTYRNLYWDNNADTIEDQFGLVKVDGTPKPSLAAFEALASSSTSSGGTTSGGTTSGGTTSGGTTSGGTTSGGTTSGGTTTTTPPPDAAPTVSLTSPVANTQFVNSLSLAANASDDKGVTKVEFYFDGKLVASDSTAPYSATYNASKKTAYGTHKVYAKAYDAAGHVTTSATVTVSRVKTLTATIAVDRAPKHDKAAISKKRPGRRLERKTRRHARR
jgi:hypothetical protein